MTSTLALLATEETKQVRRSKTWITLGVMVAVPILLVVVIGGWAPAVPERIGNWISVTTNTSGLAFPLVAVNAMVIFLLPLGVSLFAGDVVAGEASWGSLRYLLMRPVPRWRLLATKATVAAGWSAAVVLVAVVASVAAGVAAFGWRPLATLDLRTSTPLHLATSTVPPGEALGRELLAGAVIALGLLSTFAFAFLLSTLTSRPFSAVAGGVGFGFFSRALDNVPGLHALSPWLPVTDAGTTVWTGLFGQPAQLGGVDHLALVQILYAAVLMTAAWLVFVRADALA